MKLYLIQESLPSFSHPIRIVSFLRRPNPAFFECPSSVFQRKSDMSNARSYRPISLLECLSKLLEKVIARRLTYEIGKFNLVPTNQFGGRDKSSVIDACLSLTHDIQAAWKNGLVASALAIDIKGYFNHVNHARL